MPTPAPRLLLALLAVLVLQYALVGLLDLRHSEPWPALVLPAFQTVRGDTESVETLRPSIHVAFEDSTSDTLAVAEWLHDLPQSHRNSFMQVFFCPASLCTHRATERGASREAACWARERLEQMYPDRHATDLTVSWEQATYHPPERTPASLTLQDTFSVNPNHCDEQN